MTVTSPSSSSDQAGSRTEAARPAEALPASPGPSADSQEAATRKRGGHRPPRVLVVDDLPDAADGLVMMLAMLGADARAVYGGEAAMELLGPFQPDLLLLDIGMPGLDGNDLARLVRACPGFERVPLVAVSGWTGEADRRRGMEAGFDVYLAKPLDLSRLRSLMSSLGLSTGR
jgi:CheY-like chemotaxis protein